MRSGEVSGPVGTESAPNRNRQGSMRESRIRENRLHDFLIISCHPCLNYDFFGPFDSYDLKSIESQFRHLPGYSAFAMISVLFTPRIK